MMRIIRRTRILAIFLSVSFLFYPSAWAGDAPTEKVMTPEELHRDRIKRTFRFTPDIITNIYGHKKTHHLLVRVDIILPVETQKELLAYYAPIIRDKLITLYGNQSYRHWTNPELIESLRQETKRIIQTTLTTYNEQHVNLEIKFSRLLVE